MTKQFPVSGLKELDAYLSAFPKNIQKGAVRSGIRAAANQIATEAKLRAKGRIPSAIKVGSSRVNQDGSISIRVYVDERKYYDAYTAYFIEYGVRPHLIGERKGERIKLKIGENVVTGPVQHPGHAASPFMRPALDTKAKQAIEAFADQVQEYLYSRTGLLAPYVEVGEAA